MFFERMVYLGSLGEEQYALSSPQPRKGRACVNISCVIHPSAQTSIAFVYSDVSRLLSIPASGAMYPIVPPSVRKAVPPLASFASPKSPILTHTGDVEATKIFYTSSQLGASTRATMGMPHLRLQVPMCETLLVNDEQAFEQLSGNSLRLTLRPFHLQVIAEVAVNYVFHRDMNILIALVPPEKLHE